MGSDSFWYHLTLWSCVFLHLGSISVVATLNVKISLMV